MAIKVAFVSLGCPKNQIDTEIMLAHLLSEGFELVPEDINADAVIINTCGFIQSAKEEAIENILDVAWLKENRALKQRPKFTVSAVLDGKYFSEFEEYYQDTFPYRDKFLDINSKISKAFSKTQGNSGMVIVEKQEKDDFAGQNID